MAMLNNQMVIDTMLYTYSHIYTHTHIYMFICSMKFLSPIFDVEKGCPISPTQASVVMILCQLCWILCPEPEDLDLKTALYLYSHM